MIGGGNNNFINNNWNHINNRPGWGVNRPGGDWWSQHHDWNHWHNDWHDHCINHHHGWYHGCWNNNWGNNWYAPLAWGAVGWGLGSWYGGGSYYNPYYYSAEATVPYDYSQPVVVTNYVTADTSQAAQPAAFSVPAASAPPPPNEAALAQFDQGLADFKARNYSEALSRFDAALKQLPGDPVVHEVRALTQFATGDYRAAAAGLNSLLATAPGMDWTTMSSLYGNVEDYTTQLRKLEGHCKHNPQDAAAYFVLAYHYLVAGHQDAARSALETVVREQPKDAIAKRMLDSLTPAPSSEATTAASPPPAATSPAAATPATAAAAAEVEAPQTDLVGKWRATGGDTTIALTIADNARFMWSAAQAGKPPIELQGEVTTTSDTLILDNKEQGSMVGRVKSDGPNKWHFAMAGGPPNDPGLTFERVR